MKNDSQSNLDEIALYAAISKHLPEWAFIYVAAKDAQDANGEKLPYPIVPEQGNAKVFISTEPSN